MKRFLILFFSFVLVISCFAVTAFAEDSVVNGNTVVNYLDYVTGYDLFNANNGDGWALVSFGADRFVSEKMDSNGLAFGSGVRTWNMSIPMADTSTSYVIAQFPGGNLNSTFMDLKNVPSGSVIRTHAICDAEYLIEYQTELLVWLMSGISYYDANFNYIDYQVSEQKSYSLYLDTYERFDQIVELTLDIPSNARYCTFYFRANFAIGRTSDVELTSFPFEFQFEQPDLRVRTSYIQALLQGVVQGKPPSSSDTIIGVDELEDYLSGQVSGGVNATDQVFNESSGLVISHLSGFLFMSNVIERMISVGWLRGVIVVSLSLGLLGFIANFAMVAGRSLEHRSKGKGGKS